MKLLLTSGGLTNISIEKALFDLIGKLPKDTTLCFVPTASNVQMGDKGWLINDVKNLHKQGFKEISIADISAVPEQVWKPQLDRADVLCFSGGNPYHLMEWIQKSGLISYLPAYLKTKVWLGISAGSMVTNPDLGTQISQVLYKEDFDKAGEVPGLDYVDFNFIPHLNSPDIPSLTESSVKIFAQTYPRQVYALDDQSAVKIVDGEYEIISEGKYFVSD